MTTFPVSKSARIGQKTSFFGNLAACLRIHTSSHSEGKETAIRVASVSSLQAVRHWPALSCKMARASTFVSAVIFILCQIPRSILRPLCHSFLRWTGAFSASPCHQAHGRNFQWFRQDVPPAPEFHRKAAFQTTAFPLPPCINPVCDKHRFAAKSVSAQAGAHH